MAFIGEIKTLSTATVPKGWLNCDGRELPIKNNQVLYTILGNRYGGDGIYNFKLPDLRGRVTVGFMQGDGLSSYDLGEQRGVENVAFSTQLATDQASLLQAKEHSNVQPVIALNFIIAAAGDYPVRQ